jgi:hypothetical protein
VDQVCPEGRMQLPPKASDKLRTWSEIIVFGTPCKQHVSYVDFCILSSIIISVNGYKVGRFGESIHDLANRIKFAGHQR